MTNIPNYMTSPPKQLHPKCILYFRDLSENQKLPVAESVQFACCLAAILQVTDESTIIFVFSSNHHNDSETEEQ